jgi:hypothetical protein
MWKLIRPPDVPLQPNKAAFCKPWLQQKAVGAMWRLCICTIQSLKPPSLPAA